MKHALAPVSLYPEGFEEYRSNAKHTRVMCKFHTLLQPTAANAVLEPLASYSTYRVAPLRNHTIRCCKKYDRVWPRSKLPNSMMLASASSWALVSEDGVVYKKPHFYVIYTIIVMEDRWTVPGMNDGRCRQRRSSDAPPREGFRGLDRAANSEACTVKYRHRARRG